MRIEALILTRDEAANLADCVHSVRPAVDEITVFDTGSRDNTSALTRELGVRWVPIPWRSDFAQARNLALQQLHGDWILVIDADERLAQDSAVKLRSFLQRAGNMEEILFLEKRTYTDDVDSLGYVGMSADESMRRGAGG